MKLCKMTKLFNKFKRPKREWLKLKTCNIMNSKLQIKKQTDYKKIVMDYKDRQINLEPIRMKVSREINLFLNLLGLNKMEKFLEFMVDWEIWEPLMENLICKIYFYISFIYCNF